ncbi:MAG TPA: hypothetical protein EYH56_01760 [Nanoarchaeota archaeon]|nr:hypothetical protein [Nanoarchaeota archaeon]
MNENNQLLSEAIKKEILRKILTKEALERLGRVKLVNPTLAMQLESYLIQIYQTGQIKQPINDEMLKKLLESLSTKKKGSIKIIKK